MLFPRHLRRLLGVSILLVILINWHLLRRTESIETETEIESEAEDAQSQYPLLAKYIEKGKGSGGGKPSFCYLSN